MMKRAFLCMILCAFFPGILLANDASENEKTSKQQREVGSMQSTVQVDKAMFAGGCFWCMEKSFEQLEGVITVISGYSGGQTTQPTYQDYAQGGHIEVIEVTYDSRQVTYEALLELFWHQIDPTDEGGQFADRGHGYSTAIFYMNDTQQILAAQSKAKLSQSHVFTQPIVTVISAAQAFYAAEDYHQDYYKNNPVRYWYYRKGSGRDQFLNKVWGARKVNDLGSSSLQNRLTAMQYKVTQESGTEPAFHNAYWDNKAAGIYVDIVSGEPLFSSIDQFESGTGWPSFSRPLVAENIVEREDSSFFSVRTELRSKKANSHLGHVFTDGPKPTGLRYCLNSASLRFIPANALEEEGYKAFASLFEQALP